MAKLNMAGTNGWFMALVLKQPDDDVLWAGVNSVLVGEG